MPPPQAILCHLCNGKYFKHSFPIHLKKCEEKWKKTHSRCENCGSAVANHDWSDHRMHCKPVKKKRTRKLNKNKPLEVPQSVDLQMIPMLAMNNKVTECEECEADHAVWKCVECEQSLCALCEVQFHKKGARSRHTRIPMNAKALQKANLSVITENDCKDNELTVPSRDPTVDPRRECKFCDRKFNPNRVEKHMRICSKLQKVKRRKIYDGAKKRVEGTVFEEFMYNRSQTPEKVKEWKKNSRRWKEESSQIRQIAVVNSEIKTMRENNGDRKDEENEIDIKVPAKKPIIRKPTSSSSSSSSSYKKQNFPLKGSSLKIKQRSLNHKSTISSKRDTKNTKINSRKETAKLTRNGSNKYNKYNKSSKINKKPQIPKFNKKYTKNIKEKSDMIRKNRNNTTNNLSRRSSTNSSRRSSVSSTVSSKYNNKRSIPIKSKINESEEKLNVNPNFKKSNKRKVVQKENNSKNQQPAVQRTKSEANSLPRGIELGLNVNKMFDDAPKTMNDYVERERLRRKSMKKQNSSYKLPKKKTNSIPTKKMSKLQIKKEIKIENKQIGGGRKPSNSRDLSSKRAAFFESLLQQNNE